MSVFTILLIQAVQMGLACILISYLHLRLKTSEEVSDYFRKMMTHYKAQRDWAYAELIGEENAKSVEKNVANEISSRVHDGTSRKSRSRTGDGAQEILAP